MAMTTKPPGTVSPPTNLTETAESNPASPNDLTEEAAATVASPNDLTEEAAATVASPNDLTEVSAAAVPRSASPIIDLDFGANCYELNRVAKALLDIATYTRSSSATYLERYINQFGQADYRLTTDFVGSVENLITYSEQFDNAVWTPSDASITSNKDIAPDGTRTADRFFDTTDNTVHTLSHSSTTVTSGAQVNLSVRVKLGESITQIGLYETQSADGVLFDIQSGIIISELGTPDESSIRYDGDGWYILSITVTVPGTSAVFRLYANAFTANIGSGGYVSVWGAQLTESLKTLPYVKTTSTSVTEVLTENPIIEYSAETGEVLGYLPEGSSTNVALNSEDFNNASWSKTELTVSNNGILAPDRSLSADGLIASANLNVHQINDSFTVTNNAVVTLSVFAKKGISNFIVLYDANTGNGSYFNLNDGTVGSDFGTPDDKRIEPYGDDWYRISVTVTASGTVINFRVRLTEDGATTTFTGDGSSVYSWIWGAQVEEEAFVTSYIMTTTSPVARSDADLTFDNTLIPDPKGEISILSNVSQYHEDLSLRYSLETVTTTGNLFLAISGGLFRQRNGDTAFNSTTTRIKDTFYKQVLTYSEGLVSGYVNGVLENTQADVGSELDLSSVSYIGGNSNATKLYGHIKKIAIYNYALSNQEVSLL